MKYAEAFKSLGYFLHAPRQDWSAESEDGVCISIWRKEIKMRNGIPWFDTKLHAGPLEIWIDKPGNQKRKHHLSRAMKDFSGTVDVVIVHGTPGVGYEDADPWDRAQRSASWQITELDSETGHFCAEVRRIENSN